MGILLKEISSADIDDGYEFIIHSRSKNEIFVNDIDNIKEYNPEYISIQRKANKY